MAISSVHAVRAVPGDNGLGFGPVLEFDIPRRIRDPNFVEQLAVLKPANTIRAQFVDARQSARRSRRSGQIHNGKSEQRCAYGKAKSHIISPTIKDAAAKPTLRRLVISFSHKIGQKIDA
jgi:hypothetical protein